MFRKNYLSRLFRAPLGEFEDGSGGGGSLESGGNTPGLEGQGSSGAGGLPASNPYDAVPRSWAAEHHPLWERVPPEVRQVVHKREADVERGFKTYGAAHQNWTRLAKHFEGLDPNLDAAGIYETLAQNHLTLQRSDPETRKQLFMDLAKYYGVEFAQQATGQQTATGQPQPQDLEKQLAPILQKMLAPFAQRFQAMDQQAMGEKQAKAKAAVDAFFSDPKNEFITEVGADLAELLKSGQVSDLKTAYEIACLRSPTVRSKYLAKQSAPAEEEGKGKEGAGRNVRSTGEGAPSGKGATMDETMKAIVHKHYGRVR